MIKVNLLRNRTSSIEDLDAPPNADVLAAKSLGIMIIFPVLLYVYENQNLSSLKSEVQKVSSEVRQLTSKLKSQKAIASEAKELSKELNQVKDRVKAIKDLTKDRLVELKSLDSLQSLIPEKVWLEKISYADKTYSISGVAVEIEDITVFKSSLDGQPNFVNVSISDTKERVIDNSTVHTFNLTFKVEYDN